MTRYSKKDVEAAVSRLAELIGAPLKLAMHSPGDRYGTRYRVHMQGSTPSSLGRQLLAECGAQDTTRQLWAAAAFIGYYIEAHKAPSIDGGELDDMERAR